MTALPRELDVRGGLSPRARPSSWLDQVDEYSAAVAAVLDSYERAALDEIRPVDRLPDLHPGVGVALLACRCGNAIDLNDMRSAAPIDSTTPGSLAIRPIVCPACARKAST